MLSKGAQSTKKVVAIGMLGVGKSTLLNCAVNLKTTSNPFLAKDCAKGVT